MKKNVLIRSRVFASAFAILFSTSAFAGFDEGLAAFDKHDYASAYNEWRPLADHGNPDAQAKIADLFLSGQGVLQDIPSAIQWYKLAGDQRYVRAQTILGILYAEGKLVPQDANQAIRWYTLAANQGDVASEVNLGTIYSDGRIVEKDMSQAVHWTAQAANQGQAAAQFNLGLWYNNGKGLPQDLALAREWYSKSANQGDSKAQYYLGYFLLKGLGGKADKPLAVSWFGKAAAQGYGDAQVYLGQLYFTGEGVARNYETALQWTQKASDNGLSLGQANLGLMYATGKGVPQSYAQAAKYYGLAADQGLAEVQVVLAKMYHDGQGVKQDYANALKWYRKAAEQNNLYAQMSLGYMYYRGEGVAKDEALALEWYRKAADKGSPMAKSNLAFIERRRQENVDAGVQIAAGEIDGRSLVETLAPKFSWLGEDLSVADDAYRNLNYDEAHKLYLVEALNSAPEAENMLGVMALWGRGTPKNNQAAFEWLKRSAEHGNATGMDNLAYMYQQGLATRVNLEQALFWYGKAEALNDIRGKIMRPVIEGVLAHEIAIANPNDRPAKTISDSVLIGSPSVQCDPRAKTSLLISEEFVKKEPIPNETYTSLNATLTRSQGDGISNVILTNELIGEYAAAGCFEDASRLLTLNGHFSTQIREMGLKAVAQALTHFGYYDRSLALGFSAEEQWAQEQMLRNHIVQTAEKGDYELVEAYIDQLRTWDQRLIPWALWQPLERLSEIHQYQGVIHIATAGNNASLLGVDGNLVLAKARYYLKDRQGALQALKMAEDSMATYKNTYITPFDHPLTHIAEVQAMLTPNKVDDTVQAITHSSLNFPIQTLNKAVRASTDKTLRLHWLKEIDQLAPEIVKQQKDLKYDNTTFICLAAEDYAMLGMYQKSLDLMQERGCNRSPRPDEQYSRNLAQVFRVAAVRNDIGHVIKMIPVRVKDQNQEYLNHIPPVIYGLVRIGRYKDALEYLKQLEQVPAQHHEALIDLIAEIGIIAKDDFPIEDWITEIDAHRNKLSLSQWDTYRILFSICARTRGVNVATELAGNLPSDEIAAARIGIAEGLRGYRIEPTYTFYKFN